MLRLGSAATRAGDWAAAPSLPSAGACTAAWPCAGAGPPLFSTLLLNLQIRPDDAFGQQMLMNLEVRGALSIHLSSAPGHLGGLHHVHASHACPSVLPPDCFCLDMHSSQQRLRLTSVVCGALR